MGKERWVRNSGDLELTEFEIAGFDCTFYGILYIWFIIGTALTSYVKLPLVVWQRRRKLQCPLPLTTNTKYSRTSIKQPPSIKRPFSKVPNYLSLNVCIWYLYSTATSIKWPRPPLCCRKVIIYCFFTSIKRPANWLFKQNGDRKTIICIKSLADRSHKYCRSALTLALFRSYQDRALSIGKANDMFLSLQLRAL